MKTRILKATALLAFSAIWLVACNDKPNTAKNSEAKSSQSENKTNNELKGYMLAGIYTINGYGGIEAVEEQVGDSDETSSYITLLGFPFEKGQVGVKASLAAMWHINSKDDLIKNLGELLNNEKGNNKAWDYARLVNNVNMGYAAGYITKEEGQEWINKTLPKAQAAFKTWADYHKDFMEGRNKWSSDDEEKASFEDLAKNISNMSVYKNNPLN